MPALWAARSASRRDRALLQLWDVYPVLYLPAGLIRGMMATNTSIGVRPVLLPWAPAVAGAPLFGLGL